MEKNQALIDKLPKGDIDAFKIFFESFYPSLCLFANRYLNDEEASLDMVQDAFAFLWSKKIDFPSLDSAKSYLFKYVKNRSLNYLRDKQSRDRLNVEIMVSETYFRDSIIEEETYQIIHKAIQALPPQSRKIMFLSLDGYKNQEIADHLNISINTVKTIKLRAFRTIRNDLDPQIFTLFLISCGGLNKLFPGRWK